MAFAPFDFFAAVIAPFASPHCGRFDRWTVAAGRTGSGFPSFVLPHARPQPVHDLGPRSVLPPLRKIVVDRTLGGANRGVTSPPDSRFDSDTATYRAPPADPLAAVCRRVGCAPGAR